MELTQVLEATLSPDNQTIRLAEEQLQKAAQTNLVWHTYAHTHTYTLSLSHVHTHMYNGTPLFRTPLGQLVLIKGGVLISGGALYTSLCSWDRAWYPDYGRYPHFRGVLIEGFHCIYMYVLP